VDVEDLSKAEQALWEVFPRAETVDLGGTGEVRAEVIGRCCSARGRPRRGGCPPYGSPAPSSPASSTCPSPR
jgi:hypothetical protein